MSPGDMNIRAEIAYHRNQPGPLQSYAILACLYAAYAMWRIWHWASAPVIARAQRVSQSTAIGLMACGGFIALVSVPLYLLHVVGAV